MDEESDATSSGNEWEGGDEDEHDDHIDDEEEDEDVDMSDNSGAEEGEDDLRQSLVISLRYTKNRRSPPSQGSQNGPAIFEYHSTSSLATSLLKEPAETLYLTNGLDKSLTDASRLTENAAPTHYLGSTREAPSLHEAPLTGLAATAQFTNSMAQQPKVSHSSPNTLIAPPAKNPSRIPPDYSHAEEPRTPRVS